MNYSIRSAAMIFSSWENKLRDYQIPSWKEIPDIGLYMDQVITYLKMIMDFFPVEHDEDEIITSAAVNNYVRKKIMPMPEKKKYYRTHLAYLIMICTLKQSLSMADIAGFMPVSSEPSEVQPMYETFLRRHSAATEYLADRLHNLSEEFRIRQENGEETKLDIMDLITTASVIGGMSNRMTEKLAKLDSIEVNNE